MRAFRELQAHGFIVATQIGHLGVEGQGKATTWRLTEIAAPGIKPTKEFLAWKPGCSFPVAAGNKPAAEKPAARRPPESRIPSLVVCNPVTREVTLRPSLSHQK